jgi:hypothetical protein
LHYAWRPAEVANVRGTPLQKPPGLSLRAGVTTPALLLALIHERPRR